MMNTVIYQVENRIANIWLNRPEKRNALNPELIADLSQALAKAKQDPEVKVVVLKANGEVFSAGADLAYLQQLQQNMLEENIADSDALKKLFYDIYTLPKLVIAQVEGHAIAGGCGLASICDIVFAVPDAQFGYTEVKIGFIPALVSCFLVRKLGEGRTKELLLSGNLITAETAEKYGLINYVIEADLISNVVADYATKIVTETSGNSIALSKSLINQAQQMSLEESLDLAVKMNAETRNSEDCKKGIAAFLNKQKLSW